MNPVNQPVNAEQALSQISEVVSKNNSGIIAIPANPTPDAVASATALYLALTKLGKNVTLVCATDVQSDAVGADKIQKSITAGGDNLVVSFPYSEGAIDKVDYNIQGTTFNLVIMPRAGFPKLEPKEVQFSYTGGKIEFIIVVDAPNLNSLGAIYQQNQNSFQGQNVINIDRHLINNSFGLVNYVNKTSSSTSELILKVIKSLRIELDKDMATNLYAGVTAATNGFTAYSVNAETFETAAELLKAGAVKKAMPRPGTRGVAPTASSMGRSGMPLMPGMPMPPLGGLDAGLPAAPRQDLARPMEDVDTLDNDEAVDEPENWLKPKIFSGNGGLI